jgi:hypothetical protein
VLKAPETLNELTIRHLQFQSSKDLKEIVREDTSALCFRLILERVVSLHRLLIFVASSKEDVVVRRGGRGSGSVRFVHSKDVIICQ